ncbi:CBF1-interacting co-repressor CIR N-terminal [Zea mays]|uniref:CBF1-interacting co-repressor CIR N-terminal n=1 Tax=Zea mays TaxID=4577 RepID=A0A1D6ENM2_MAIZE|nr:CBF1-interacting co-repressor CIR N-terminal [Zea mays]
MAPRRPRQLLRLVAGVQALGLAVLHLNVATAPDATTLYTLSRQQWRSTHSSASFPGSAQERLDFLYESGLAVGKSSDGFQALQQSAPGAAAASTSAQESAADSSKAATPGALFEDKPQSANDTWRKLHSDPLLLIRQRGQDAISRIKNNPIKMAEIKKSVKHAYRGVW